MPFRLPDWKLTTGIAGPVNLAVFLIVLCSFPFLLPLSGALAVASIPPGSPTHTVAFVRFCLKVTAFLWLCFFIALFGIKSKGAVRWTDVIGGRWSRWSVMLTDLSVALITLVAMALIGNGSSVLLGRLHQDSSMFRSMVAQNGTEAAAFLLSALTAGFVEEFIFRGYLQRQFTALFGGAVLPTVLQVALFTLGHLYQGWIRLVPVFLMGFVLTIVALARRRLVPGMLAHGLGDGLVALIYFAKHV